MTEAITWLKSDQIDGGSHIDLLAITVTPTMNTHLSPNEIPGKDEAEPYSNKIHEVNFFGISNQDFKVTGQFDKSKSTTNSGSVMITIPRMASFWTLGSPAWFYDSDMVVNPAGSTHVMIKSFTPTKRAITGSTISYTGVFTETKAW